MLNPDRHKSKHSHLYHCYHRSNCMSPTRTWFHVISLIVSFILLLWPCCRSCSIALRGYAFRSISFVTFAYAILDLQFLQFFQFATFSSLDDRLQLHRMPRTKNRKEWRWRDDDTHMRSWPSFQPPWHFCSSLGATFYSSLNTTFNSLLGPTFISYSCSSLSFGATFTSFGNHLQFFRLPRTKNKEEHMKSDGTMGWIEQWSAALSSSSVLMIKVSSFMSPLYWTTDEPQ